MHVRNCSIATLNRPYFLNQHHQARRGIWRMMTVKELWCRDLSFISVHAGRTTWDSKNIKWNYYIRSQKWDHLPLAQSHTDTNILFLKLLFSFPSQNVTFCIPLPMCTAGHPVADVPPSYSEGNSCTLWEQSSTHTLFKHVNSKDMEGFMKHIIHKYQLPDNQGNTINLHRRKPLDKSCTTSQLIDNGRKWHISRD